MPLKKGVIAEPFIYSEKKIKQLTQYLQERITEHMRLQSEGKLPYCKRIPVSVVEIRHIMEILGRSRSTAQRVMARVREYHNKKDGEYVTVEDFSAATGINERIVQRALDLLT